MQYKPVHIRVNHCTQSRVSCPCVDELLVLENAAGWNAPPDDVTRNTPTTKTARREIPTTIAAMPGPERPAPELLSSELVSISANDAYV